MCAQGCDISYMYIVCLIGLVNVKLSQMSALQDSQQVHVREFANCIQNAPK